MMGFTDMELRQMSDDGIIQQIGKFVRHQRLKQNLTQENLAQNAGMNRSTIYELEQGKRISLITLVQVLRALDQLSVLSNFKISNEISPIELAKLEEKLRKRASGKNDKSNKSDW